MCESYYRQYGSNFVSIMPTNLYGPNDNFDLESAHVLPALLRKFHEAKINGAKEVEVWGTGQARREFMHVDDMADACLHVLENINASDLNDNGTSHLNVGTGVDISILDLALKMAKLVEFSGSIQFRLDKPDGTLRKLLDNSRINKLGWEHKTSLDEGLKSTYDWYKQKYV